MQKNDDKRGKNSGFAISAVKGFITGVAVILAFFAIAAAFISSGRIPESAMNAAVYAAASCGAFAGAYVAIKSYGPRVLAMGTTVGLALFLLSLTGSAFSETGSVIGGMTPGLFAAILIGSLLAAFLKARKKGRKRG